MLVWGEKVQFYEAELKLIYVNLSDDLLPVYKK